MKKNVYVFSLILLVFSLASPILQAGTATVTKGKISPSLLLQNNPSNPAEQMPMPRNFTIDKDGNFYVFDYMDNGIRKYSPKGKYITTFGKKGKGEKDFKHLMAIKVSGGRLVALDSVAVFHFSLQGKFINRKAFTGDCICNYPQVFRNGAFIGEQIHAGKIRKGLILRDASGGELDIPVSYDLKEFFPTLEKGKDFFLGDYQTRSYLYALVEPGTVIWAASDKLAVYKYKDGKSTLIIEGTGTPQAFPPEQREKLEKRRVRAAKSMPLMHQYVPGEYQLLQHLAVGETGIWLYVKSRERTGLVRYSFEGKETGFYALEIDADMTRALMQVRDGQLYIMVPGRKSFKIYAAPEPKG